MSNELAYEFHIAGKLRDKYNIDETFFATDGNILFTDFPAVRRFVFLINSNKDPRSHIYPGEVYATGLLEEIFHLVFRKYEMTTNPLVFDQAIRYIEQTHSNETIKDLLFDFTGKFPPLDVYSGKSGITNYIHATTKGKLNTHIILEELVMFWFANYNPANKKLKELFDKRYLEKSEVLEKVIVSLSDYFEKAKPFPNTNLSVFEFLRSPIDHAPDDVSKQLDYILDNWKEVIPGVIYNQLLRGKDLLKEDVTISGEADGGAPVNAPGYKGDQEDLSHLRIGKSGYKYAEDAEKDYDEPEKFTPDVHWMPSVVMLAKNTYVWLDQLSKKYQRDIRSLNMIPDEELDNLRRQNFTALWLIGIWERSVASKRIKHIMGNTDAVSSAYSLYDYTIASDLGGENAYENLNERCRQRGIRLASDMVPNHTGLFSNWVINNPDYFIQSPHSPFPGYRFTGENLSQHPDIEIRIEDGYFSKTDAAVVFQRIDKRNHNVRYIYHGNDGTVMPWNDTAQLDMIKKEVREAVIHKIFEVARKFSIIRFDAAMTLAKKHFSRLWYPKPGSGGDIPSRSDYAMERKQFDELFPVEFWREVVDRMNQEMPETLLLAEAFWFMEGYFVRSLGMHRVYNSAFMHMLKNEENEKYRDLITNTLEFEPEILKRYVNFMSNPDEETAINQFGTGDKYFGICMLMATLPGLPMFAHGQVEGYNEKYGMEYQRAYYNENPQEWLVQKHQEEIFPITEKRYLFSEVENFNIFDFTDSYGNINENVFAYTNTLHKERALVLFNNKYERAEGKIQFSSPKLSRKGSGKEQISLSLADALNIHDSKFHFYIYREHFSGLEYLKTGEEIHQNGFQWALDGFEHRLFWEFKEVYDTSGEMEKLYWKVAGGGIQSLERARKELQLEPVHTAFNEIFSDDIIEFLLSIILEERRSTSEKLGYKLLHSKFNDFLLKVTESLGIKKTGSSDNIISDFTNQVKMIEKSFDFIQLNGHLLEDYLIQKQLPSLHKIIVTGRKSNYRENMIVCLAYIVIKTINTLITDKKLKSLYEELYLEWPLKNVLIKTGKGKPGINKEIQIIQLLLKGQQFFDPTQEVTEKNNKEEIKVQGISNVEKQLKDFIQLTEVRKHLGVNAYEGIVYYSKEKFEELIRWLFSFMTYHIFIDKTNYYFQKKDPKSDIILENFKELLQFYQSALGKSEKSGFQFDKLLYLLGKDIGVSTKNENNIT